MNRHRKTDMQSLEGALPVQSHEAVTHDHQVVQFVTRLGRELGIPLTDLASHLDLSTNEFDLFLRGERALSAGEFSALADHYGFSLESFFLKDVDFQSLKLNRASSVLHLPEKYVVGGFSKRMMAINLINYVGKKHGSGLKQILMDRFQITSAIFQDAFGPMNVVLFEDMLNYLKQWGFRPNDIHDIGVASVDTYQQTWFSQEMASLQTPARMFEHYLTHLIPQIERNNVYVLSRLDEHSCQLQSHEAAEVCDLLHTQRAGGPGRCQYRVGALSAATKYLGLPCAHVHESTCVHRGDAFCTFEINFEAPNYFQQMKQKSQGRTNRGGVSA